MEDYVITLLLMVSVVRQLRGRPLTWLGLAWPLALVAYAGTGYLRSLPVGSPNLAAAAVLAGLGAGLGLACGALSQVYCVGSRTLVRSTGAAAVLWIVGVGSRLAFGLYAEHGGAEVIGRVSARLGITDFRAWSVGLILMSLLEVLGRSSLLTARKLRIERRVLRLSALPQGSSPGSPRGS